MIQRSREARGVGGAGPRDLSANVALQARQAARAVRKVGDAPEAGAQ